MSFGSPRMCISTMPEPASRTRPNMPGARPPETSFTMQAPASMAAAATSGFRVSIELGMSSSAAETEPARAASGRRQAMGEATALLAPVDEPAEAAGAEVDPIVAAEPEPQPVREPRPRPESFESFFQAEYTNLLRAMYLVAG